MPCGFVKLSLEVSAVLSESHLEPLSGQTNLRVFIFATLKISSSHLVYSEAPEPRVEGIAEGWANKFTGRRSRQTGRQRDGWLHGRLFRGRIESSECCCSRLCWREECSQTADPYCITILTQTGLHMHTQKGLREKAACRRSWIETPSPVRALKRLYSSTICVAVCLPQVCVRMHWVLSFYV